MTSSKVGFNFCCDMMNLVCVSWCTGCFGVIDRIEFGILLFYLRLLSSIYQSCVRFRCRNIYDAGLRLPAWRHPASVPERLLRWKHCGQNGADTNFRAFYLCCVSKCPNNLMVSVTVAPASRDGAGKGWRTSHAAREAARKRRVAVTHHHASTHHNLHSRSAP